MKESFRHIGDTNRVIALSELFLSNKDSPTIAFNFLDDGETVLLPEMVGLRIIFSYAQPDHCFADLLQIRANILNDRTSDLLSLKSSIHHKESYISDVRFRISINEIQNRIRLFHFCRSDRAQTVDSYDTVLVGFRYLPQLLHIRPDEFWPAFAENPEDLRRFHSYFVIFIVQKLRKYWHVIFIDIRSIRGDVFRGPDKRQPDFGFLIKGEAEQICPILLDHRITAPSEPSDGVQRPLSQKRFRTVEEGSNYRY